jgi:D-sedoheptulose 7-phosphate isomerase
MIDHVEQNFTEASELLQLFISNPDNFQKIRSSGDLILECVKTGGKVITCGNGGSMCDAIHFAEELTGRFRNDRPAIPAIAISDSGYITCAANDFGFDKVFSRFISAMGKRGDVLVAISTSGNSPNVIEAAKEARDQNIKVIGLTGKDGGKLSELCDLEIRAPYSLYADRTQELHIKIIHSIIHHVEIKLGHKS